MAVARPVAVIVSVIGKAYVRHENGELVELKAGDIVLEGQVVITSADGRVELDFGGGSPFSLQPNQTVQMTAELTESLQPSIEESALQEDSFDQIVQALENGGDLDAVLEAPAAGTTGDGDAGSSFVRLTSVIEELDPSEMLTSQAVAEEIVVDDPFQTDDLLGDDGAGDVVATLAEDAPTVALAAPSDTGTPGDNISNDPIPAIVGTGTPGDSVSGTIGGTPYGPITVPASGEWTFTPSADLPEGPVDITVTTEDPAGNITPGASVTITVDTTAPEVDLNDIALTNDDTPELTGTVDDPATAVVVTIAGVEYPAVNNGDGTWTLADNVVATLGDGTTPVAVSATDIAGNTGTGDGTVIVDVTAPDAPTVELSPSSDTGVPVDNTTNDPTPEIIGTGTPGDIISGTIGGLPYGPITVPASGEWTFTPSADLPEGPVDITVTTEDPAGNITPGASVTITVDTTAPEVDLNDIALTNDDTPELTGTVDDPATAVVVTIAGVEYPAVNNGDGTWTLADNVVATLGDGTTVVDVKATNVAGNTGTGDGTVTVNPADTDVNAALSLTVTPVAAEFIADATNAGDKVADVSANDPDGSDLTYTLSDNTNYVIVTNLDGSVEVQLTAAGALIVNGGADLPNFTVSAASTTGQISSDDATVNPADTDVNAALSLTVTPVAAEFIADSTNAGDKVADVSANDPDGSDLTYTLSDNTNYVIVTNLDGSVEVQLTAAGALIVNGGADLPNFTVSAASTTGQISSDDATVNPADTDVNAALSLTVTPVAAEFIADSTNAGDKVADVSANDPDGSDLTYTLSDNTNYVIVTNLDGSVEVQLTAAGALIVNGGADLPNFTVSAASTTGQISSDDATVNPADTDVNAALSLTVTPVAAEFIADSTNAGDKVADVSANDPDGSDLTYTLSDNTNYVIVTNLDGSVEVQLTAAGALIVNGGADLPNFTVSAASTTGQISSDDATVNPADTDVNAALSLTVTPVAAEFIADSTNAGDKVADVSANDPDGSDLTYTLSDNTNYVIVTNLDGSVEVQLTAAGALIVNGGADLPNFTVSAASTTGQISSDDATVNPADTDVNAALSLTVTPVAAEFIADSTNAGDKVADVSANDPDGSDLTYTLSDNTNYVIVTNLDGSVEVQLTAAGALIVNGGADLPNFTVSAASTTGQISSDDATVNPADTDVNAALSLTVTPVAAEFIADSTNAGDKVADVSANDPDGSDLTYTLSDNTNYVIVTNLDGSVEVQLTAAGALIVNGGADLPNFTVSAASTTGQISSDDATVNPADTDVNAALSLTVTPVAAEFIADSTNAGDKVADVSANDPDGSDLTYTLSDNTNYVIVTNLDGSVEVQLTAAGALIVNGGADLPNFTVSAASTTGQISSDDATVNPADTDVNAALSLTVTPVAAEFIADSTNAGDKVADVSANDPDGSDLTYTLSDNTNYVIVTNLDGSVEVQLTAAGALIVNGGADLPNFTVSAASTTGQISSDDATVNPADTDVNAALSLTVTPVAAEFIADSTNAGDKVADVSANDPDGSDLTYTLSDNTNYVIVTNLDGSVEVQLTAAGALIVNGGADLPNFTVSAASTTGQISSDDATVNPADTDVNAALSLTVTPVAAEFIADSTNAGDKVADVSANDPDGSDLTYTLSDNTNYVIVTNLDGSVEVQLTAAGALIVNGGADLPNFTVSAASTTGQISSDDATVNPADTDVNAALSLTVTPVAAEFIADSTNAGDKVADVSANDPDGSDLTYTLSDNTNYVIVTNLDGSVEVQLTAAGALIVNGGADLPNFTVSAASTTGQISSDDATVNPADTDVNAALSLTVTPVAAEFIADSTNAGDKVADVSANDPDGSDLTYTLSDNTNYVIVTNLDGSVEVQLTAAGALIVNGGADLPNFTVSAASTTGQISSDDATVNPADTDVNAALSLTVTPVAAEFIADSTNAGDKVADVSANDPDGSDLTYTLSDNTNYVIVTNLDGSVEVQLTAAGALIVNGGADLPNFTVSAASTTGQISSDDATVNPADTDVNAALSLTVTPVAAEFIADSTNAGDKVADVSANDPDGSDLTYTLSDNTNYVIVTNLDGSVEVQLTAAGALIVNGGADLPNFTVSAASTTGQISSDDATVNPADTDVNAALSLTVTPVAAEFIADSTNAGDKVADVSANDPDGSDLTYTLSDNTNYVIVTNLDGSVEVQLTAAGALIVNGGADLPNFTVSAASTTGQISSDDATVNPADTDVNAALSLTVTPVAAEFIADSTNAGDKVADVSANDPDGSDLTYTLSDNTNYVIVTNLDGSVEVQLTAAGALIVNGGADLPNFTVSAASTTGQISSDDATVNPADTDVNAALSLTVTPVAAEFIADSTNAGDKVADVSANDPDGSDLTYTLSDNTNYVIVTNLDGSVEVQLTAAGALIVNGGADLPNFTVSAASTTGQISSDDATVNPADTDVNAALSLTVTPVAAEFIADSTNAGDKVADVSANDPDGSDLTYTLSDNTNYVIVTNLDGSVEVQLTAAGALIVNGGADLPNFTVSAASTTGQISSDDATVNPADTDVNAALSLTVTPVAAEFIADSTNAGDKVADVSANDPDGSDLTYTLSDNTNYVIVTNLDGSVEVQLTAAGALIVNGGADLPNFTVSAASTTGQISSDDATVNPADTDVNAALSLTVTPVAAEFIADSTNAGDKVADVSANDPDGSDLTYTLSDNTNYVIVTNLDGSVEVQLTAAGALIVNGGADLPNFTVSAASTTGQISSDDATVNPADTDVNAALSLTVTPVAAEFIADSTNAGDKVADVSANDPDGSDLTYTLSDNTNYVIVTNLDGSVEVQLTAAGALIVNGGADLPNFTVSAASTTGQISSDDATVNPADTDVNAALSLTVTPVAAEFIADSTNAGDKVADVSANDPDGSDLTYTLSDNTNYVIVTNLDGSVEVQLTAAGALIVNGGADLPNFTVSAASTTGQISSDDATVNPADTDVNAALSLTVPPVAAEFIADSTNAGDKVADVSANDPDGSDLTYTLSDNTNYVIVTNLDGSVEVQLTAAGALIVNGGADLPNFTVSAASTTGQISSDDATVNPADTDVNAALSLTVTPVAAEFIADSTNAGDKVADVSANDPDGSDLTYTLSDNTNYVIVTNLDGSVEVQLTAAGALIVNGGADLPNFTVSAASTTGQISSDDATVNPADTDVNAALSLTVTPVAAEFIADSTNAGDKVADVSANDPDGSDLTYTLSDNTNYVIVTNLDGSVEVQLTAAGALIVNGGADLPNFTVSAASTTGQISSDDATVNPADTDVNAALSLTVTPVAAEFIADSTNAGDKVADVSANDPDGSDLTYTLSDNTNYVIVTNLDGSVEVQLTAAGALIVNGGADLPNFTVSAASTTGQISSDDATVNPADTDVNAALSLTVTPVAAEFIADSTNAGDKVADVSANDPDGSDLTYTLSDNTNYVIVTNLDGSVEVQLTAAGALIVNGGADLPNFTVSAASTTGQISSDDATVNPADTDVNDAPVAENDGPLTTAEETQLSNINVLGNDSDADNDTLSVTAANAANGTVIINADGSLNYTPNADFVGADSISYSISDGKGGSASASVSINVTNVNDAPVVDLDADNSSGSAGVNYETTFTEGGGGVAIADSDIAISDIDDTHIESAVITITNVEVDDLLIVGSLPTGITAGAYDATTGTITLTGSSTLTDYQQAIRAIQFDNVGNSIGTDRTIEVTVNDGQIDSNTAVSTVNITTVPTISIDDVCVQEPDSGTTTMTFTVSIDQALDSELTFDYQTVDMSAVAGSDYVGIGTATGTIAVGETTATITVTINSDANVFEGDESFTLDLSNFNQTVNFQSGAHLTGGGVQGIGSIGADNGAPVAINDTFITAPDTALVTGNVLANDILVDNAVYDSHDGTSANGGTVTWNCDGTFTYTPDSGFTGTDTFTYTVIDDDGETDTATVSIEVSDATVNPPLVSLVPDTSYTENDAAISILSGTTLTDVDSSTLASVVVKVDGYIGSQDVLDYLTAGTSVNASVSVSGSTWEITLTNGADINEYQSVLNSLTYANTSDNPSASTRAITVTAYDETYNNLFSSDSGNLSVLPVNDAPNVFDNNGFYVADSLDNGLNITIPTDPDTDDADLIITVTGVPATLGTVTLADGTLVAIGDTLTQTELAALQFDADSTDGKESFTYSVFDGVLTTTGSTVISVGSTDPDSGTVYESALADGTGTDNGLATVSGNLFANDAAAGNAIDSVDFNAANYTSIGGVITIDTEVGTLTVYADDSASGYSAGDYVYELTSADDTGSDVTESFTYHFTNSGTALSDTLSITIEDDEPVANDLVESVPESEEQIFNVVLTLDDSGSMNRGSESGSYTLVDDELTRMEVAKQALEALAGEYFDQSSQATVTLVTFNSAATFVGTYDTYEGFETAMLDVGAGGGTNYVNATDEIMIQLAAGLASQDPDDDVQNISYFISDGEPNDGTSSIGSGYIEYMSSNGIDSYAVGIGSTLPDDRSDLNYIHNIDSMGAGYGTVDDALIVEDVSQLKSVLLSTVPTAYGGNITVDVNSSISNVLFGADGGFVESISLQLDPEGDGTSSEYQITYDGTSVTLPADLSSVDTDGSAITLGAGDGFDYGTFSLDFSDGSYTFSAPNGTAPGTFEFDFTVVDGDGDADTATATINIVDDSPEARDDLDSISAGDVAEGNVITAIGTDGGSEFGEKYTSFARQGGGVDKIVDDAVVTDFTYKGETISLADSHTVTTITSPDPTGISENIAINSSTDWSSSNVSLSSNAGFNTNGAGVTGGGSDAMMDEDDGGKALTVSFDMTELPNGVENLTLTLGDFESGYNDSVSITLYDSDGVEIVTRDYAATNSNFTEEIDLSAYSGIASLDISRDSGYEMQLSDISFDPTPSESYDVISLDASGGDNGSNLTWIYSYDTDLDGNLVFDVTVTDSDDGSTFVMRSNGYYNYDSNSTTGSETVDLTSETNVADSNLSVSIRTGGEDLEYNSDGVGVVGGDGQLLSSDEAIVLSFDLTELPNGVGDISLTLNDFQYYHNDKATIIITHDSDGDGVLTTVTKEFEASGYTEVLDLSAYSGVTQLDIEYTGVGYDLGVRSISYVPTNRSSTMPVLVDYTLTDSDGQADTAQLAIYTTENEITGTVDADSITGGAMNDAITGDDDDDILAGGDGHDSISGGTGADTLSGDAGNDYLSGGADADTLFGGSGQDHLSGDAGDDIVDGGTGDDIVQGGTGDDKIFGGAGDDLLEGEDGADILSGGSGDDTLLGGAGADILLGGAGDDQLAGGLGSDVFKWELNDGGDSASPAHDTVTDFGQAGADTLDLSDLLVGESKDAAAGDSHNLDNYLHFDTNNDGDTVVHVSSTGDLANAEDQTVTLTDVSLESLADSSLDGLDSDAIDARIIADMIANGKLITD